MDQVLPRERLLGALQDEILTTDGVAPFNCLPTLRVKGIYDVYPFNWTDSKTEGGKFTIKGEVSLPASARVPRFGPEWAIYVGGIILDERGYVNSFVPLTCDVHVEARGIPRTKLERKFANGWFADGSLLERVNAGETVHWILVDRQTELKPMHALVVFVASKTQVPVDVAVGWLSASLHAVQYRDAPIDEGISQELSLTLRDPGTLVPIEIPVRGRDCDHAQAFDLKSFVYFTEQKHHIMKCTVCQTPIIFRNMVIDATFREFLRVCKLVLGGNPDRSEVQIHSADYARVYGNPGATNLEDARMRGGLKETKKRKRNTDEDGEALDGETPDGELDGETQSSLPKAKINDVVKVHRGQTFTLARIDMSGIKGKVTVLYPHPAFPPGTLYVVSPVQRNAGRPENRYGLGVAGKWRSESKDYGVWEAAMEEKEDLHELHSNTNHPGAAPRVQTPEPPPTLTPPPTA
eukprot:Hpha_TRINITY_DN15684_c0_g2::TRINITY_DN15684_c0_g2_i7::g.100346::m.100346